MKEISKKALEDLERLLEGKSTINEVRQEYGLKPLEDNAADKKIIKKEISREDLGKKLVISDKKVAELEGSVQEQPKQQLLAKKTTITFKKLKDSIFEVELLIGSLHLKGKAIQIPSNTHNIFSVIYLEASND